MSLISLLMSIFVSISPAMGNGNELIKEIDQTKHSVSKAEASHRKLYAQVLASDKKVKELSKERSSINEKVLSSESDAQELAFEVKEWEAKVKTERQKISRSIAQIYQLKNPHLFSLIFSDQSAAEIERNVRFLRELSERDFKRFRSVQISLKEAKLARQKLKSEVKRLLVLRENLKIKESQLLQDQKRKSALLNQIRADKSKNIALLRKLRSKLPELDQQAKVAIFEKMGELKAPVEVPPSKTYGSTFDPIYKVKLLHLGWTFENLLPTSVKAIFQGKVTYVGQIPGFGRTIILDHGDHYFSVYAYHQKSKVFEGEEVFAGQTIASATSQLYFELRHFSNAVDPAKWISLTHPSPVAQSTHTLISPHNGDSL